MKPQYVPASMLVAQADDDVVEDVLVVPCVVVVVMMAEELDKDEPVEVALTELPVALALVLVLLGVAVCLLTTDDQKELTALKRLKLRSSTARLATAVVVGVEVAAATAEAPVMLAVAAEVTAAETDETMDAVLMVTVWFQIVSAGPVTVGAAAVRMALKSSCWGAGDAATMPARAAADKSVAEVRMMKVL